MILITVSRFIRNQAGIRIRLLQRTLQILVLHLFR
jgi:hypothetical protein